MTPADYAALPPDVRAALDDISGAVQACVKRKQEKRAALAAAVTADTQAPSGSAAPGDE